MTAPDGFYNVVVPATVVLSVHIDRGEAHVGDATVHIDREQLFVTEVEHGAWRLASGPDVPWPIADWQIHDPRAPHHGPDGAGAT